MAEDPAAFQASFASMRHVPSRGVVQLVFEVPSEQGQVALTALGGLPSPSHQPYVAIARMVQPRKPQPKQEDPMDEQSPEQEGKDAVIAAGIRAREADFQQWILGDGFDAADPKANADAAAAAIRERLGVKSRTELRTDRNKLEAWRTLIATFEAETGRSPR